MRSARRQKKVNAYISICIYIFVNINIHDLTYTHIYTYICIYISYICTHHTCIDIHIRMIFNVDKKLNKK
jgi:hypothetical protein